MTSITHPKHVYTVRARYADTDPMGYVYHSRYFEWFEAARTEFMRVHGMPYKSLEESGLFLPAIEAVCRYRRPVYYDEEVYVHTKLEDVSRLKLKLHYHVVGKGDTVRVEGHTIHCFIGRNGRPRRAPEDILVFFKNIQFSR